jgi:hypothetical protein
MAAENRIAYFVIRVTHHAIRNIAQHPLGTRLLLPASFFLFSLLFISPLTLCPNCVGYQYRSPYSDLMITHLPNAEYLRASLMRYGQWPLWNAQIFAGQPFAADPLAGMWYPPNLLLLILPLPFAFNLLFALHLAWAGYGLFRYLKGRGLRDGPALFGGLAFAGTPKLIAHLGAGHVSLLLAVAWTPWLLIAVERARDAGGLKRGAIAGAALALIFLADVRWSFYAAALAAADWIAGLPPFGPKREARRSRLAALAFAAQFLLLSAALLLPLLDFVARTNRGALTLVDAAGDYSLPVRYLLGLLIPNLRGDHEWMTYLGVAPLLLALLSLRRGRALRFWWLAVLVAIAFSLGTNFVLFPILFRLLPGLAWLRVPPRAWFVAALGVCVLAAYGLQLLLDEILPRLKASPALPRLARYVPSARATLIGVAAFTVIDLWRVDVTLIEARPRPERGPASQWIAQQAGLFRVYSPSYSLPLDDGLQHVDGINPLQLANTVRYVEDASGVPVTRYGVTLPPFDGDLASANADALPDARKLGALNVKYVAAEFPLDAPQLALVQTFGRTRVYENLAFQPRAWMDTGALAEIAYWSPNRIVVRAQGPGRLTLSEVNYPGWNVTIDGAPAPMETAEGLLRGVRLDAGMHQVVFEFWPPSVSQGLALSAIGVVLLIGLWRWGK